MDDRGVQKTFEEKVEIAGRLSTKLTEAGLPPEHIYFDILLLSCEKEPLYLRSTLLRFLPIRTPTVWNILKATVRRGYWSNS